MNPHKISDRDVQILAETATLLHADYSTDNLSWEGSPFAWTKERSSSQQGAIAKKLVAEFLSAKGFSVDRSPGREADRVVDGLRVAIKSSTPWEDGNYKFQQFRDQNYDIAICLGISPFDAHCWVIPKSVIIDNWGTPGGLRPQHRGQEGKDTAWLGVDPQNVQGWLLPYGGTLSQAVEALTCISSRCKMPVEQDSTERMRSPL